MSFRRAALRKVARAAVYPIVEQATLVALLVRKAMAKALPPVQVLNPAGGQRVLVVAAHPDDETIGCAGAIFAHLEAGDNVQILMVTDGSGSRAGGLSPGEMTRIRRREVEQLRDVFHGAEIRELGLRENRWQEATLAAALTEMLKTAAFHLVYAPSCVDFHPEHLKVARALAAVLGTDRANEALRRVPGPAVRVYEMQVPLGVELVNLVAPLARSYTLKARGIEQYASQRGALDLWKRQARYLGALYRCEGGAEVYWQLGAEAYGRVIARGNWTWRDTPFASLTGRPFGDLRAHIKGSKMRRQLGWLAGNCHPI